MLIHTVILASHLTICVVHLGAHVRLDKEAREAGGHVELAVSPGVVW